MKDFLQIIEQRKDIYLEWLIRLCRQPSIAAQNVGMAQTAQLTEQLLQEIGVETRQIPTSGYPVVYGEIGSGAKTLVFYNHYDVQPPEPLELWDFEPFGAEIHNGTLFARGVADNKGNVVARIAAVDVYLRARGKLPERVKFIIEGEEEIGSVHLEEFVSHHQDLIKADACIWEAGYTDPTGRPSVYLGAKGMLYVELAAQQANVDLHSSWGTVVPNAAWYLLEALQTLRNAGGRVLIPGFYDRVKAPSGADIEALQRMNFDEASYRQQFGLTEFKNGLTGLELVTEHIFQPTCTICGIWSGYTGPGTKTVLPHQAKAKLDFRLVPEQDPMEILDLLKKHLAHNGFGNIQIKVLGPEHPARTPTDHPFAKLVADTAREVYRKEPVVYPIMPGTGPMYVLCEQYGQIPTASIGVGNSNSRNHAPNENIHLKTFIGALPM
jgi:acetylornithine deacetylase/succinyl-diaminopimelate desuccinylase-like protein